jgi:hypothetical protein
MKQTILLVVLVAALLPFAPKAFAQTKKVVKQAVAVPMPVHQISPAELLQTFGILSITKAKNDTIHIKTIHPGFTDIRGYVLYKVFLEYGKDTIWSIEKIDNKQMLDCHSIANKQMVLQSRDLYYDAYSPDQAVNVGMNIAQLAALIDDNYRSITLPFSAIPALAKTTGEGACIPCIGTQAECARALKAAIADLCGQGTEWRYSSNKPKGMIGTGNNWYVQGGCSPKL